jgi:hypothetical protein
MWHKLACFLPSDDSAMFAFRPFQRLHLYPNRFLKEESIFQIAKWFDRVYKIYCIATYIIALTSTVKRTDAYSYFNFVWHLDFCPRTRSKPLLTMTLKIARFSGQFHTILSRFCKQSRRIIEHSNPHFRSGGIGIQFPVHPIGMFDVGWQAEKNVAVFSAELFPWTASSQAILPAFTLRSDWSDFNQSQVGGKT